MTKGATSQSGLRTWVVRDRSPPNFTESAKMSIFTRVTLPSTPARRLSAAFSLSNVA
jgi:hypothetical protein